MKLNIIFLIGIFIFSVACSNDENTALNIDGEYSGTFQRDNNIARVEIEFINETFSGNSIGDGYAIPIYYGAYSIDNDIIVFNNKQLILPAVYDPSTLLDGMWNFTFDKNVLTMTKSNGDQYILIKN